MMRRFAWMILWLGMTTCCPTLWLAMTKTSPAPWPEVPTPEAIAPVTPSRMPNRFDVLNGGRITPSDDYHDDLDSRADTRSQQDAAFAALADILKTYKDTWRIACEPTVTATVGCVNAGNTGASANCVFLIVNAVPADAKMVIVGDDEARVIETVARDRPEKLVKLVTPLEKTPAGPTQVCFMNDVPLAKPLLSFVHMSDIQLRDPSVVLTDRRLSKRLDWFGPLSSFEYDEDLAFYNQYILEAMVATINAAAVAGTQPALQPSFVIHTGDSIDAGMVSELKRFHRIIDRLRIPFYELFGNHDVLVFGNLTPTDAVAQADDRKCSPVGALLGAETAWAPNKICVDAKVKPCSDCSVKDVELVASTSGHTETRRGFMAQLHHNLSQLVAQPRGDRKTGSYCEDTRPKVMNDALSYTHGFDLGTRDDLFSGDPLGYYAFVAPLADDDRHAVFIALDGEDLDDNRGGILGHIGHAQLQWLQSVLACVAKEHARDLVFVLAHQPLSGMRVDPADAQHDVEATLRASPNVVAYLFGHHHKNEICGDRRPLTCTKFWEIQTASLIEFPQEARMVRIKQVGKQLGFLEVSTFHEQLVGPDTPMARYVQLARRGAERDDCTKTDVRCSADQRPYRDDGNSTDARLFFPMP
jgi:hypothetical protein